MIREALESAATRYGTRITNVNPAYTSQLDSRNNLLLGKRNGDRFKTFDGLVVQADINAARNILARANDREISTLTPYRKVREILQARTAAFCSKNGITSAKDEQRMSGRQRVRGATQGGKNARKRDCRAKKAITIPVSIVAVCHDQG
jgi:hypothetical protein